MRYADASLVRLVVAALVACLSAGATLPFWMATLLPEPDHVCACSLDEGHHCRCPKCSREAHEELLEELADGRPRILGHDCDDEHGPTRLAHLPQVVLPGPLATRLPPPRPPPSVSPKLDLPRTRLLEPPPHPPPIV